MKPLVVLVLLFSAVSTVVTDGFGNVESDYSPLSANGGYRSEGQLGGGYSRADNKGFSGTGIGGFGSLSNAGYSNGALSTGNVGGGGGYTNGDTSGYSRGGQIRKFVTVHVAPDEPQIAQTKVIRAGGPPDKHINIIFVKAPSMSSQQNTEVILPEVPAQKTLVYVLVKKQESTNNVRVRGPAPSKPSRPEVYFIRYKGASQSSNAGKGGAGFGTHNSQAYGPPSLGGAGGNGYN